VVAEEDYTQMDMAVRPAVMRRTRSDFLLALAPDGRSLVPFRDVFEVDGAPIRDRDDRLRRLFLESPSADVLDAAARVQSESARYSLVSPKNTVNVPTNALWYLLEPTVRSFDFRRGREETVEGVRTLRVDFEETGSPTVVYLASSGEDVPSSGSYWIDPLTGRILKTVHRAERADASLTMVSTVVYRRSDALGLWVPADMRDAYRLRSHATEGHATYSNFRSFQVKTRQEIKIDK
jgi:hypothetical protein